MNHYFKYKYMHVYLFRYVCKYMEMYVCIYVLLVHICRSVHINTTF